MLQNPGHSKQNNQREQERSFSIVELLFVLMGFMMENLPMHSVINSSLIRAHFPFSFAFPLLNWFLFHYIAVEGFSPPFSPSSLACTVVFPITHTKWTNLVLSFDRWTRPVLLVSPWLLGAWRIILCGCWAWTMWCIVTRRVGTSAVDFGGASHPPFLPSFLLFSAPSVPRGSSSPRRW